MAKELPFFKFEPAEWQNGNIQMLPPEIRAIYIDVCCVYWQRLGSLPYALALHKHCGSNTNALKSMEEVGVISVNNDKDIVIEWLDEQLEERNAKSVKASESANKRWAKKRKDANAMRTHSERNAKRREEKRKEESIDIPTREEFVEYCLSKKQDVDPVHAGLKYDAWVENGWKDGNGKPVKNWKSKLINTIPHLNTTKARRENPRAELMK